VLPGKMGDAYIKRGLLKYWEAVKILVLPEKRETPYMMGVSRFSVKLIIYWEESRCPLNS
jgi:hypothetical protein